MEAQRLIEGAPFNPELAKACGEAFDQASAFVVLCNGSTDISALRLRLAHAVLKNAEICGTDVDALVQAALGAVLDEVRALAALKPGAEP